MSDDQIIGRVRDAMDPPPRIDLDPATVLRKVRRRKTARKAAASITAVALVGAVTVGAVALRSSTATVGSPDPVASTDDNPTADPMAGFVGGEARAAMAAAAPDPAGALDESTWADAPYWYVETLDNDMYFADQGMNTVMTRERWVTHTGSDSCLGDLYVIIDHWTDGREPEAYLPSDDCFPFWPLDDHNPRNRTWDTLSALPTDPTALDARLREAAGNPWANPGVDRAHLTPDPQDRAAMDKAVWGQIARLHPGSPAPLDLRLAFVQVAEGLSTVTVTPGVTDAQGRTGVAISGLARIHPAWEVEGYYLPEVIAEETMITLIVDPTDGTVLERRSSTWTPGPFDAVSTYLAMGPVQVAPETDSREPWGQG
ncbi:MAG: hypothetical protein FWD11_05910 [Micrococcales bacterium]|nr:hypothetical protein [Micrococcales bacterium]